MSVICFCFGDCLITWGNLFVPEANHNSGWFFNSKERDHHPPTSPCAYRFCQIQCMIKLSRGCWDSFFIMLFSFLPFTKSTRTTCSYSQSHIGPSLFYFSINFDMVDSGRRTSMPVSFVSNSHPTTTSENWTYFGIRTWMLPWWKHFHEHIAEEIAPSWTSFLHHNTYQFEQWLIRWKLPHSLIQYWQDFLRTLWDEFKKTPHGTRSKTYSEPSTQTEFLCGITFWSCSSFADITLSCTMADVDETDILGSDSFHSMLSATRTFAAYNSTGVTELDLRTVQMGFQVHILSQHCLHPSQTFARLSESTPNCGLLQRLVSDLG
jgi:hypothetical protein